MESAAVGETVDAGEIAIGVWDIDMLIAVFGEIDLSEYEDRPLDYDAAIQEPSLESLFTN